MSKRILVVEDTVYDRSDIEAILKKAGFSNILFAANYTTALELLKKLDFDAVLIDINLNDAFDGITLAATIDKEFFLPYIFVTGQYKNSGNRIFQEIAELKCKNFVTKPIDEDDLISNLQIAIYSYRHYVAIADNVKYDLRNKVVKINNKNIKLSDKKTKLLDILVRNINCFVSREAIKYHIWEDKLPRAANSLRQLKKDLLNDFLKYNIKLNIEVGLLNGYKLVFQENSLKKG